MGRWVLGTLVWCRCRAQQQKATPSTLKAGDQDAPAADVLPFPALPSPAPVCLPRLQHDADSSAKTMVGTAAYLAPEVIRWQDVYDAKVCWVLT